jgi:hypothetical protein
VVPKKVKKSKTNNYLKYFGGLKKDIFLMLQVSSEAELSQSQHHFL